jgi:hypothetical protein
MHKFWNIPLVSAYIYAATILTFYGYNEFFNIPSNLIEFSIRENVVYFYNLITAFAHAPLLWVPLALIIVVTIFTLFYKVSSRLKKLLSIFGVTALFVILLGFHDFGKNLAAITDDFYTIPADCLPTKIDTMYIVPNMYEAKLILVPINTTTKKMEGGFIMKDATELNCVIKREKIGKITY